MKKNKTRTIKNIGFKTILANNVENNIKTTKHIENNIRITKNIENKAKHIKNTENKTRTMKKTEKKTVIAQKIQHITIILLFLVPMYLFFIISIFDKDKTISEKENRTLNKIPAFSLSSLFKGSYTIDYENYYSDTFPLRDMFITANSKITGLYANSNKDGMNLVTTIKNEDDFQGEALHPINANANVNISSASPSKNANSINTTNKIETIPNTTENTTKEASLPTINEPQNVEKQGAILIADTRAMELYSNVDSSLVAYADSISLLQSKLPDVQVYNLMAPTSIEFYSPEDYHTGTSSQKEGINTIYNALKNGAKGVDAYSELRKHVDEYIYFRTDHHWTARGAYYAYVAFSKLSNFKPVDINKLTSGKLDDFVGTMYMFTQNEKLKQNPDFVEYFLPSSKTSAMIYYDSSMTNGLEISVITPNIESSNKYLTFIEGDNPITYIKSDVENGKKILIIKESYGNALVPFLSNNYEEIYVIDPRQIDLDLPAFIKEKNIQEVLCINYLFAPSNNTFMNAFNNMIK